MFGGNPKHVVGKGCYYNSYTNASAFSNKTMSNFIASDSFIYLYFGCKNYYSPWIYIDKK